MLQKKVPPLLLSVLCTTAQGLSPHVPLEKLDAAITRERERQNLSTCGLGVGFSTDLRDSLYLRGYGWENHSGGIPFDPKVTMVRWASISKTLAAVVATELQETWGKEKVDIDANVEDILLANNRTYHVPDVYMHCEMGNQTCESGQVFLGPADTTEGRGTGKHAAYSIIPEDPPCPPHLRRIRFIAPSEKRITLRHLLSHTSGIQHYTNGFGVPVPPQYLTSNPTINTGTDFALHYFKNLPLVSPPGTEFHYSTFGFILAATTLESPFPFSFDMAVHTLLHRVAPSLQLDHEWIHIPHRAVGYAPDNSVVPSTDTSYKSAGGGFISTTQDMLRYCRMLLSNKKRYRHLWKPVTEFGGGVGYGMGFMVRGGWDKVWHTGAQEKARTVMSLWPGEDVCVVVMSNCEGAKVEVVEEIVVRFVKEQFGKGL
ncbi:hypothetical protein HK104_000252 [Borealophlyctis nickersoniae]|nr:hypothetical protein HK104_000252 [Borealophlyctis nickersoniae]